MSKLRAIMGQAPQKEYAVFFGHVIENRPMQIFELADSEIGDVDSTSVAKLARWLLPHIERRRVPVKDVPEHIKKEAAELGYELDTSGKPITEKWFTSLGLSLAVQVDAIVQIQNFFMDKASEELPRSEEEGKIETPTGD